jgi:NAD(P)-dependent dehydrogenase (short-subunit alcohol dehydrogenase family)
MPLSPARAADAVLEATVVGSFTRLGFDARSRMQDWTPADELDGVGRTVLVTGANSGLGKAAATMLARTGAAVRLLVRSDDKGNRTRDDIVAATGNEDVAWYVADLTDLAQVREVAARIHDREQRLYAVIHNAGAMFPDRRETVDGIEATIALHVVGPHLLTSLLVDRLALSSPGRVIWMASGGMYATPLTVAGLQSPDDYRPATAYARAKRAQVVMSRQWQERVGDDRGIVFHAMHPGWALTPGVESSLPVFRRIVGPLFRTPEQGADTAVWLTLADEPARLGGRFWLDRAPRSEHKLPSTRRPDAREDALWGEVNRLAGMKATAPQG